jgi:XRE family transcriptional regulator of biofilm formation
MIGKRIQKLRIEKGLTLSELAERADVAKSYLSNMERDVQSNPSIHFLEKVAAALDTTLDVLLHGTEASPSESLDPQWADLIKEAMHSGVTKEQFREFLEFNKWKKNQSNSE